MRDKRVFIPPDKPEGYTSTLPDLSVYRPVYKATASAAPYGRDRASLETFITLTHKPGSHWSFYHADIRLPDRPHASDQKWRVVQAIEYWLRREFWELLEANGWESPDRHTMWHAPFEFMAKAIF